MGEQTSFIDGYLPAGFGRNERLERIAGLLDWGRIGAIVAVVRRGDAGRPPYRVLAMFRALLLQQWYGLSDPGLEEALGDRVSFRRFCGFALDEATPDETTICRFRNDLKAAGLGEALFAEVVGQLDRAGYVVRTGTLIDASLVAAAVRPPKDGSTPKGIESRSALDPDANWTREPRRRQAFFGYKLHVGVDQGSGLIRSRVVTPAKTTETEVADRLMLGDERAVGACPRAGHRPDPGADKAYSTRARRAALRGRGIKDRIQHRRVRDQAKLPHWQVVRNKLIGRIRSGVERTFALVKGRYGLGRMRYRGLEANAFHVDLVAIAHNLRRRRRAPEPGAGTSLSRRPAALAPRRSAPRPPDTSPPAPLQHPRT